MNEDDPDIGGPAGGKTRSHRHFQVLPQWTAPLPIEFQLTDREIAVAEIAAYKNAKILRAVVIALTIAGLIVAIGATAGIFALKAEIENRASAIYESRLAVLEDGCRETNSRNRRTLGKLHRLYGGNNPTRREKRSRTTVTLLVSELQPYRRDCKAYARDRLAAARVPA